MFFKKKKTLGPVPPEEVQRMLSTGMADKDVIKNLKSKGYSYDEIERAMMGAVKQGVEEPAYTPTPKTEPFDTMYPGESPLETILPELGPEEAPELEVKPEMIIEDLIEGALQEKWEKFASRIEKMEEELNDLTISIKKLETGIETRKEALPTGMEEKINDLTVQVDDISARVGGLEKAFRQFLPSLTKNIESLSRMVHEMKHPIS